LPNLNTENQERKKIAKRYLSEIKNNKIQLPVCNNFNDHVFHLFVIRTESRDVLQEYLFKNGIETVIHYPIPPHIQKALQEFNHLSLPITEKIHQEVLSLPISSVLTDEEITHIIATLNSY
jgi:dTDP-4-amino-4,6-dideoxygalactose transaminase